MKPTSFKNKKREGFSFLELQVAMILLGIALVGVVPLVVMQTKQLKKLEARLDHGTTYYLIPSASPWARKLGAPATIQAENETVETLPAVDAAYEVAILSVSKSMASETVQASVALTEIEE